MTYDEMVEIADAVFDEYLPKANGKIRKAFCDALFSELEDRGSLEIEDQIPEGEYEDEGDFADDEA
jgi:hypothetical protein